MSQRRAALLLALNTARAQETHRAREPEISKNHRFRPSVPALQTPQKGASLQDLYCLIFASKADSSCSTICVVNLCNPSFQQAAEEER
jgi:hypothetical protein